MSEFFGAKEYKELEKRDNYSIDSKLENISEQDLEAINKRLTDLQQFLGPNEEYVATYKIEVMFSSKRSVHNSFAGAMTIWQSGSELSGGGDSILFPCPTDLCLGYIGHKDIAVQSKSCFCSNCKMVHPISDLREIRIFNLPDYKWAWVISKEFIRTGCRSDIYLKSAKGEIRKSYDDSKDRPGGYVAESLVQGRKREASIYRLKSILKDTNVGSSIGNKVLAFLRA